MFENYENIILVAAGGLLLGKVFVYLTKLSYSTINNVLSDMDKKIDNIIQSKVEQAMKNKPIDNYSCVNPINNCVVDESSMANTLMRVQKIGDARLKMQE